MGARTGTRLFPVLALAAVLAASAGGWTTAAAQAGSRIVVSEVLADPGAVADDDGEWIELFNAGDAPADLRGWRLASRADPGHVVARSLIVRPGAAVVLARSTVKSRNGGVRADYAYGSDLSLANASDWIALRNARGATVDSVAWSSPPRRGASWALRTLRARAQAGGPAWTVSTAKFGRGDRGTPGRVERLEGAAVQVDTARQADTAGQADTARQADTTRQTDTTRHAAGPVYRSHVEFGTPRDSTPADDHLMEKRQYALSYNPRLNVANWVSWNLNRTHFGDEPRSPAFTSDPELPARFTRVVSSDYTGSGYSRGHLVRSEERTATPQDNASTFLLTNILPQTQDLNGGPWLGLERWLQEQAQRAGQEIYVVAGGIFPAQPRTLNGRGRVAIPTRTWKIAVLLPFGRGLADVKTARDLRVVAVDMPNENGIATKPWRDYLTTVDALEQATGYDFLDRLPDAIEAEVERERGS
ncbi:MAG TPA: DNA/RNA non-specific endonuclease [Longimicrobiaceae bacterium]